MEHIETRQEPLEEHHAGDPDLVRDDPHDYDQFHQEADVSFKMGASVNFMLEPNYFKEQRFSSSFLL